MCRSHECTFYIVYVAGIFGMNLHGFKYVTCVAHIPFTETL